MEISLDLERAYPNMIKHTEGYPQYPVADTLSTHFVVLLLLLFRGLLLHHIEGRLRLRKFHLIMKAHPLTWSKIQRGTRSTP